MAREEGILEKHPDFFGEVPVDTLLYTIASIENEDSLLMVPGNALSMLKKKKDFVLVGRCGNVVFGKEPDVMRIFLTGNKEKRIKTIAQKHNISERSCYWARQCHCFFTLSVYPVCASNHVIAFKTVVEVGWCGLVCNDICARVHCVLHTLVQLFVSGFIKIASHECKKCYYNK